MVEYSAIVDQCSRFTYHTGVQVSARSAAQITDLLNSVLTEPHWSWNASVEDREQFVSRILTELPDALVQMYQTSGGNNVITYFDVVHFISERLVSMCPFEKVSHRARDFAAAR